MATERGVDIEGHCRFIAKHQPKRDAAGAAWAGPGIAPDAADMAEGGDLVQWVVDAMFASGLYWGLHAEAILGRSVIDKGWAVERILACRCEDGGFAGSPGHDAHVLYTYSAVQTLALCGVDLRGIARLDSLVQWVSSLQAPDGSFACDEFGDPDTRFGYAALATLRLLRRLDAVDTAAAVGYVRRCCTAEGAFGASPGAEAHAGQTFCCVASLAICGEVQAVATDPLLRMWLSERQNADGGASGRPGKRTDACYAWWVGATTAILSENSLVDRATLTASVLRHQARKGGIAAHQGDKPDLFHTHFGLAALGVLGHPTVNRVDPIHCLPSELIDSLLNR